MTAWTLLMVVAVCIAILVMFARRCSGYLKPLLLTQAVYWSLGYILRPAIQLSVQPSPRSNDALADRRLAIGDYFEGLQPVLTVVAVGLVAYIGMLFVARRLGAPDTQPNGSLSVMQIRVKPSFTCVMYTVGWLARLAVLAGLVNPVTSSLAGAASLGAGLAILGTRWPKGRTRAALALVVAGELTWSLLIASKTPFLGVVLMAFIALAARGKLRPRIAVMLVAAGLTGFLVLQWVKAEATTDSFSMAEVSRAYPSLVHPVLPIAQRFDLLSAATDAVFVGPGQWLTASEFGGRVAKGLLPFLGDDATTAGTNWANEVRSVSVATRGTGVSLAEGTIAEGWALSGYLGLLGEAFYLVIAVIACARLLRTRSLFLRSLALLALSQPLLFERGILGGAEILGQAAQVAIFASILASLWPGTVFATEAVPPGSHSALGRASDHQQPSLSPKRGGGHRGPQRPHSEISEV